MSNYTTSPGASKVTEQQEQPAGCFSSWLRRARVSLIKDNGIDVQCGECKACCTSSYFIHIKPEETRTLTQIHKDLLFAAPGLPKGNVLLGYYKNSYCPMFIDDKCSIYEHRPHTCRNYDCRIFAAAGIAAGDDDKAQITQRTRQWTFSYPTRRDRQQHSAIRAAAKFIRERSECFPDGAVPTNPSQVAILAIKIYDIFLKYIDESGKILRASSDSEVAEAIITACKKFDDKRETTKVLQKTK